MAVSPSIAGPVEGIVGPGPGTSNSSGGGATSVTDDINVTGVIGQSNYVAEDGTTIYVTEDSSSNYAINNTDNNLLLGWIGTLEVTRGGTGQGSFPNYALLYGQDIGALGSVSVNSTTTNKFLTQQNSQVPSFNTIQSTDLPTPTTTSIGGVEAINAVSHEWINSINTSGVPQLSQPAFTDISGNIATTQMNSGTGATSSTFWRGDAGWNQVAFSNLSGNISVTQMNSGTGATSSTFWCGNGTWALPVGGVTSVSNSDGSLTISPTTGAVVASINTAHSNSFTAAQTAYALNGVGYIAPGINGVVGDGSTDDTAAIQAILNAYTDVTIAPGTYLISSTLTISMSSGHYRLRGEGPYVSSFIAKASFTGSAALQVLGRTGGVNDYDIGGFAIINQTAGSGPSYGFYLTPISGSYFGGNTKSRIFDVVSSGFAFNFLCLGVRMLVWDRCASWNNDNSSGATTGEFGWYLFGSGAQFTGDMDFDACQTVSSTTGVGVGITDQGVANSTIAGIRFRNHTFYNKYVGLSLLVSGTNSQIDDIWVNPGSQFDGSVSSACLVLQALASGSSIFDIHVHSAYFSTANAGGHIKGSVGSGGVIQNLNIIGNSFENNGGAASIDIRGTNGTVKGIHISTNQFYGNDNASGDITYFENVTNVSINDNLAFTPAATGSAFIYFAAACEWISAVSNNSGGAATTSVVNATSPAASHTAIANNI